MPTASTVSISEEKELAALVKEGFEASNDLSKMAEDVEVAFYRTSFNIPTDDGELVKHNSLSVRNLDYANSFPQDVIHKEDDVAFIKNGNIIFSNGDVQPFDEYLREPFDDKAYRLMEVDELHHEMQQRIEILNAVNPDPSMLVRYFGATHDGAGDNWDLMKGELSDVQEHIESNDQQYFGGEFKSKRGDDFFREKRAEINEYVEETKALAKEEWDLTHKIAVGPDGDTQVMTHPLSSEDSVWLVGADGNPQVVSTVQFKRMVPDGAEIGAIEERQPSLDRSI